MHGNVWEWCSDWYGIYAAGKQIDPQGASRGIRRVMRGRSWGGDPKKCRSAKRDRNSPDRKSYVSGFRVVLDLGPAKAVAGDTENVTDNMQAAIEREALAVSALEQYAIAQVVFQVGRQGRNQVNTLSGSKGYCDNFRNLHYGLPVGGAAGIDYLSLLSKEIADAFAGPAKGAPTFPGHNPAAVPYKGYLFLEDPFIAQKHGFDQDFALVAYPASKESGANIYWMGQAGQIYFRPALSESGEFILPGSLGPQETPQTPQGLLKNWNKIE
jgi:hypothetical protein